MTDKGDRRPPPAPRPAWLRVTGAGADSDSLIEQIRAETETLIAAQALIADSRDHYAALFEHAPLAQIVLDDRGMVVDVNRAAALLLPQRPSLDRGTSLRGMVVAEDRPLLDTHLRACRAGDASASGDIRLETPFPPGAVWVMVKSRFIADPGIFVTTILDRTEHRALQIEKRQIEDTERAARDASRAKDVFIAALSHELRAPLTPILAAVTALEQGELSTEDTVGLYELVHRNVLVQAHLIDDLLDVTRIVSGKIRLDRGVVDVHALLEEVVAGIRPELGNKRLGISLHLEATCSRVDGDAVRLKQVAGNLLRNAIKFTPAGGQIALHSWNRESALVVEVADSGMGIAEDALERVFLPFEQAVEPAHHGGLGLGLAICKGIMSLHGGAISAHSRGPGKGARFLLELATHSPAAAKAAGGDRTRRPAPAPQPETRLLLVEDQADVARAFKVILKARGYDVRHASTAEEALQASLDDIDLIVSDIGLPDLNGRDLLRRLHARRPVPAIALSGYGSAEDIQDNLAAGFVAHITKPAELTDLLAAIDRAVGRS